MAANIPKVDDNIDICIYHSPCIDGMLSAWIVYKQYGDSKIEFIGYNFKPFDNMDKYVGKDILFLDCCPKLDEFKQFVEIAKSIKVIDHHKTTIDVMSKYTTYDTVNDKVKFIFNTENSGCMLSWKYFTIDEQIPWFIKYAEDRDLWLYKLKDSKLVSSGMFHCGYFTTFKHIDKVHIGQEITYQDIYKIGVQMERYIEFEQRQICNKAIEAYFDEFHVWFITGNEIHRSDTGNQVLSKPFKDGSLPDFSIFWRYNLATDEYYLSMRGNDKSPDLTIVCGKYGGGGHAKTAGCTVKRLYDMIKIVP